jgi:hypothetical protein
MTAIWGDLFPTHAALASMSPEALKEVSSASNGCLSTLSHGISGIGNLLATAASNGTAALSPSAVADIGWLLESLGRLISELSDTGYATESRLNELTQGAAP